MIAMSEVKTALPEADAHYGQHGEHQSTASTGKEQTR